MTKTSPMSMPIIDYRMHPGFRSYALHKPGDESQITAALRTIDTAFDGRIGSGSPITADEWAGSVHFAFADLKAFSDTMPGVSTDVACRVHKVLLQTEKELAAIVEYKCQRHDGPVPADSASAAIQSQIEVDGIAITRLPDCTIATLRDALQSEITEVRAMAERNPEERRSLPMKISGKAWDILWTALNEVGIVGGVALHERREVRPMTWSIMQNSPSERWYRDCYADVGIETSPLAYMHYDHDCNFAKIQVYLSDVDLGSAPFSYVPGSHTWGGSPTQQMIFKSLDMAFANLPKHKGDSYYRTRFHYPEYRRLFLALPTAFQGTSHFGDDVLPDSELGQDLMRRERFVTSDVGNCMVFTGGKALHRGGMSRTKERLVLQVGVSAVPPISWSLEQKSMKQVAAERIGRFLRATIGEARTTDLGRRVRRIIG